MYGDIPIKYFCFKKKASSQLVIHQAPTLAL